MACLLFFTMLPLLGINSANALFNDPSKNVAGRPRFKKTDRKLFYFGIGVGMNPYDHISCKSCLGLGTAWDKAIEGTKSGFSSNVNFTGFPVLFFGFVPTTARFLRNHFEANIKFAPISVDTIKGKDLVDPTIAESASKGHYKNVDFSTINFRFLYELLFQTPQIFGRLALFAGGGFGFSVNNAKLKGEEYDPTATTSPSSNSNSNDSSSSSSGKGITLKEVTNFSVTFHASVGGLFDVSENFALELKGRYFFIMTPFGENNGVFDLYRHGFEIVASVLLKI